MPATRETQESRGGIGSDKLPKGCIRRLENGKQNFTVDTFVPLADYYKEPYGSIMKEYDSKPSHSELKRVEKWQKQINAFHKSNERLKPSVGKQLRLFD